MASLIGGTLGFLREAAAQPPTQINVEIDWMADGTHSHRPTTAELVAIHHGAGIADLLLEAAAGGDEAAGQSSPS